MTDAELVKTLEDGAENKEPQSCRDLAKIYYDGTHGVLQNYRKAARLFLVAAECGHFPAQYFLSIMYQKGQGVPQHYVRAHMWMNIACRYGEVSWESIREEIEELLTPEQIERAQDMAVKWLRDNPKAANDT